MTFFHQLLKIVEWIFLIGLLAWVVVAELRSWFNHKNNMNTQSIPLRKIEFGGMEKPGDFCFDDTFTHIYIWLPGVSGPDCLQIQRGAAGGPRVWGWDGNEEKPTITPSIHASGQWHGWLRAGVLQSC